MTAALPCPFCGETPDVTNDSIFIADSSQGYKWGWLSCCVRGPEVRTGYKDASHWKEAAIEAWNERTPGVMHPVDRAFYELVVKERDLLKLEVARLQREVDNLRGVLKRTRDPNV